jgi:hypothetical protein
MANPTFTGGRTSTNVVGFSSGNMFISELSGDAITTWIRIGWTRDSKLTQTTTTTPQTDDSGAEVAVAIKINSVSVEGMFISRAAAIRQMYQQTGANSVKGKKFALVIIGATLDGSKFERTTFWKGTFAQDLDYQFGGESPTLPYKFMGESNTTGADVTVAMPTGVTGYEPTGATTATVGKTEWYETIDTL